MFIRQCQIKIKIVIMKKNEIKFKMESLPYADFFLLGFSDHSIDHFKVECEMKDLKDENGNPISTISILSIDDMREEYNLNESNLSFLIFLLSDCKDQKEFDLIIEEIEEGEC